MPPIRQVETTDVHPHDYPRPSNDRYFYPLPTASNDPHNVEGSCIKVTEVELVARAVHIP
ncbi:hypothetical protein [Haladaptatus sp. DYF46]|uniref:hypothetical protein n=1 Tax=Haladaptatus sp. DYF46 TaxID=2886041 RepID=UPI001E32D1D0|nr:hypothetical protein [Haladaptatus sp. DYF46]